MRIEYVRKNGARECAFERDDGREESAVGRSMLLTLCQQLRLLKIILLSMIQASTVGKMIGPERGVELIATIARYRSGRNVLNGPIMRWSRTQRLRIGNRRVLLPALHTARLAFDYVVLLLSCPDCGC